MNEDYWENFYRSHKRSRHSSFADFVATRISGQASLFEFGCGDGRDAAWFSRALGWNVIASDRVVGGWESAEPKKASDDSPGTLAFFILDLSDFDEIAECIRGLFRPTGTATNVFYSRFVLHSISSEEESNLLAAVAAYGPKRHKVCFEYRSLDDVSTPKTFGSHDRRYIDHAGLLDRLTQMGYEIEFEVMGRGLAVFGDEDPHVGRVIAARA
ncbi:MAG: hypothetical protein RIE23_06180 [Pontimonas sp.]